MKIFIGGPRTVSALNSEVLQIIDDIIDNGYTILIGESIGVDKAVQRYCHEKQYRNVKIYASNGKARNNKGQWEVVNVKIDDNVKGFDFYAAKDLAMAKAADYGFMIWNGSSKGTLNDIINLTLLDKKVLVYYTPDKSFHTLSGDSGITNIPAPKE